MYAICAVAINWFDWKRAATCGTLTRNLIVKLNQNIFRPKTNRHHHRYKNKTSWWPRGLQSTYTSKNKYDMNWFSCHWVSICFTISQVTHITKVQWISILRAKWTMLWTYLSMSQLDLCFLNPTGVIRLHKHGISTLLSCHGNDVNVLWHFPLHKWLWHWKCPQFLDSQRNAGANMVYSLAFSITFKS